MATTEVDLQFLQRQQQKLLEEMTLVRTESQATRAEARQVRGGFVNIADQLARLDRRISELNDDYNTMLKLELGGSLANLETRMEVRLDALEVRIGNVERSVDERLGSVEQSLCGIERSVDQRLGSVEQSLGGIERSIDQRLGSVEQRLTAMEGGIAQILGGLQRLESGR